MQQNATQMFGHYKLLNEIGSGGMASVYRAYDNRNGRLVALKVMLSHLQHDPTFVARFAREGHNVVQMQHAHIVPVYESGAIDGRSYLAMRYIEGGTLADRLAWQRGPLPLHQVATILWQIASALDHAHARGIVHRDLKPSNIMLTRGGQAMLTDFGIAKALWESSLTQTGTRIGTPTYMAPEQALGQPMDARTDVYALGVVLYEMVTGRPPFRGDSDTAVLYQHVHEAPPPPRQFNPHLSPAAEQVILYALAKQPGGRYASAGQLAEAFRQAVGQPASATPTIQAPASSSSGPRTPQPQNRRKGGPGTGPSRKRGRTPTPTARSSVPIGAVLAGGLAIVAIVVTVVLALSGQPGSGNSPDTSSQIPEWPADPPVEAIDDPVTLPLTSTQSLTLILRAPEPGQAFATNESVSFAWEGGREADEYRFQLEIQDPDGAPITLANRTTQRNTLGVPLDANWAPGRYTWYVVTQQWDGEDWREVARSGLGAFQVIGLGQEGPPATEEEAVPQPPSDCVPQPPTLVAPEHQWTASSGVIITFQWQGGERCGHLWRVQFAGQFMDCGPTETNAAVCTIPDLAQGQPYTWRVVLVDAQGQVVSGGTSAERTMWLQALGSKQSDGSSSPGEDGGDSDGGDNCHTETYECNCTRDPVTGARTCETCTREVCD